MAKRDALLAMIEADAARMQDIRNYVVANGDPADTVAQIDKDIADLKRIRDYVTGDGETAAPKKPRKPRTRKGLPASDDTK